MLRICCGEGALTLSVAGCGQKALRGTLLRHQHQGILEWVAISSGGIRMRAKRATPRERKKIISQGRRPKRWVTIASAHATGSHTALCATTAFLWQTFARYVLDFLSQRAPSTINLQVRFILVQKNGHNNSNRHSFIFNCCHRGAKTKGECNLLAHANFLTSLFLNA